MARVAGIELPRNKRIEIGLTYIYGIGRKTAADILATAAVPLERNTDDLSDDEVATIRRVLEEDYRVEGDLRRDVTGNIKRYIDAQHRRTRWRRAAGGGLILASIALLWRPLADALATGDSVSVTVGVAAALTGSVLVLK